MKKIVSMLIVFSFLLALPTVADVYTRLDMVSNENGKLVVDVQAFSDDGSPLISLYRGAFKISETLEKRVVAVSFENLVFQAPSYETQVGYSSEYRKVTWVYTYNEAFAGPYSSIGTDWMTILRVTIWYNQADEVASLSWAGSPYYLVKDDQGNDITGDYYPIPPELQDFPLPVEMSMYSATFQDDNSVRVAWRTETELNNLGFNVLRSDNENEGYVKLNQDLIPGQGTTIEPTDYEYLDTSPSKSTHWYLIETISTDGLSTFYGPTQATSSSDIELGSATPLDFELHQNYPNPFNPSTEIRYQLASLSDVTLTVYDIRGNVVKTLVSQTQDAGSYSVTWSGTNQAGARVNSGIYLYELRAGQHVYYNKMTLIK